MLRIVGNTLIAASSLFFIETAFEMYFLTLLHGQQMIFFSLAHLAPVALVIVFLSGIAFLCLAIFALVVQLIRINGKLNPAIGYARFMLIVLCVQVIHIVLLLTYDAWAPAVRS
jgi:mannose/fructose/N-acetylgalactosamine-specific phosphotransferase system component IIC